MRLLRGFEEPAKWHDGFVAIGNFDGVHLGHQSMAASLTARAQRESVPSVVLTFDPHPIRLLRPQHAPPSLSTLDQKAELLGKQGVDFVIGYPTDEQLLELSPEEFFRSVVIDKLRARGLVEGLNFYFGRDRAGNIDALARYCSEYGLSLDIVPPVSVKDRMVSSSLIRSLIADGAMEHAAELLGHPYRISGTVGRGAGRGRTMGFPTANLEQIETLLPRDGVYAAVGHTEGRTWPAAVNCGANPTFGESHRKLEAHLIGMTESLYGERLLIDFVTRVRDTVVFSGPDELRDQLQRDIRQVEQLIGQLPNAD